MKRYAKYKDSGIPWIGEVPEHWLQLRGKNIFTRMARVVEADDEVITCFRDGQVTLRKNRRTDGFTESFKEIGYQGIRPGDLVIHQMDAFAGAIGVSDSKGKGTPVYICLQPKGEQSNFYYAYLLREMARTGYIKSLYRGIRERSSDFRYETFGKLLLPIPPADEQRAIVEYLDSAVGRIDGYIAEKEAEIEKLGLLKQSVIAHAVTKGINPNAKMKDSGIPWIGEVPEGWKVVRLFSVASEHFISNQKIHHQNLLSLSYGQIIRKNIDCTKGLLPETFDKYQVVEPGNIVLRFTDLQNDHRSLRVGLVKEEGIITSAYLCIASRDNVVPEYLYLILHVNDIHKVFYGMGGGLRQSLDFSEFRKLPVLLPPFSEQRAIVEFIDRKVKEIDGFISAVREQIEKLKLYKQRLISDVVTGKIKVCKDTLAEEVI